VDRIDFRSDTVTWPTPAMREAMAAARVGDDVYGDDPTVNALQQEAAAALGKEAGLLVASGTMGNLVAMLTHAQRGDEAIVGDRSHVISWEAGGLAVLGGIVPRILPVDDHGRMNLAAVAAAVRGDDPHLPSSRLIVVENTFGALAGRPVEPEYLDSLRQVADRHGLRVHLDGARLFNAAAALNVPAGRLATGADSVSICLSKGLCAPVGSVLCGDAEFVRRARRTRKLLGGGMRQAGVLAAAGRIALREMPARLADDHRRAADLARRLARIEGIHVDPGAVYTNMVYFDLADDIALDAAGLIRRLDDRHGILLGDEGARTLRAVTHYWIGDDAVQALAAAVEKILAADG
jgi:threonine aldolase